MAKNANATNVANENANANANASVYTSNANLPSLRNAIKAVLKQLEDEIVIAQRCDNLRRAAEIVSAERYAHDYTTENGKVEKVTTFSLDAECLDSFLSAVSSTEGYTYSTTTKAEDGTRYTTTEDVTLRSDRNKLAAALLDAQPSKDRATSYKTLAANLATALALGKITFEEFTAQMQAIQAKTA